MSSQRLSMDDAPVELNLQQVKDITKKILGIGNIHHIHLWAMSSTENALTAHVVVGNNASNEVNGKIKENLKHQLLHMNIQHVTLELEYGNEECDEIKC